jgi:hypothetical protein
MSCVAAVVVVVTYFNSMGHEEHDGACTGASEVRAVLEASETSEDAAASNALAASEDCTSPGEEAS